MKRSYSFFVKRNMASRSTLGEIDLDTGEVESWQCQYDHIKINQFEPYPKRGTFFKITYTLALKTGKWITVRSVPGGLFFNVTNEKLRDSVNEDFVNCILQNIDWGKGTRFNRKVEVVTKKEIEK